MDLTSINSAIDAAYATALTNGGKRALPYILAESATLRTDTYISQNGNGFRIVCIIKNNNNKTVTTRIRNHGPDTESERDWKTYKMLP